MGVACYLYFLSSLDNVVSKVTYLRDINIECYRPYISVGLHRNNIIGMLDTVERLIKFQYCVLVYYVNVCDNKCTFVAVAESHT